MINRGALFVVISLSALFFCGCSAFSADPREQADDAIAEANRSVKEHNRLFEQARATYTEVKEKVESGEDPSKAKERITEAKNTLEKARNNLDDARDSLGTVRTLDVDPAIKEYASLLSKAMDAQLGAETKEVQFYDLLEEDPALENNRERALELLSEVGSGYEKAEKAYTQAQEFANSHPEVIEGAPEGSISARSGLTGLRLSAL
jgi:tetratricopeptide (TPR) repeat protein